MSTTADAQFEGTPRFEIIRKLGDGAAGVVYEALDRESSAHVALKTLARFEATAVYDLKREFRSLANVTHPNLVRLYELVVEEERCFFTMELVDGRDLLAFAGTRRAQIAQKSGTRETQGERAQEQAPASQRSPPTDGYDALRGCLGQLVAALVHLHARGKLHRDVKPSNVLVTKEGRVVLLDFGILADLREQGAGLLDDGIVGTPGYMAPEQARLDAVGPPADWYAVGSVLYEALTGRLPFEGDAMQVIAAKQVHEPPAPSALFPGVPPDLDALCVDLLRMEPSERPAGSVIAARLGATLRSKPPSGSAPAIAESTGWATSRLVGREAAAAELERAFARAQRGSSFIALVEGVSGMGKTAFVRRFLHEREATGDALVLAGRCFERESVPYKAFDEVVDALSRRLIALAPEDQRYVVQRDAAALSRLFPVLARVPAIADAPRRAGEGFDGQQLRRRAFAALRDVFGRLAEQRPLVVFVDDVQWSDVDGVALLREIVAPPDAPPVLFILAFRAEDRSSSAPLRALLEFIAGLEASSTSISIGPLAPAEAEQLAAAILTSAGIHDRSLAAAVARESGGSPFFAGELAQLLVASRGNVRDVRDVRIDTVVRERLASLPEDARRLLEVIAVAGRPFDKGHALQASDLRGQPALDALAYLQSGSLVRARAGAEGDALECFHDRIREATCAALAPQQLARVHGRIARTLTEAGGADPEALLIHFVGSGDRARAAELAVTAARRTAQALAFDRAAQLFRAALDLLPPSDERIHALHVELGDALTNAGRGREAADAYFAAADSTRVDAESVWLKRRAAEELLYAGVVDRGQETLAFVLGLHGMRFARARWQAIVRVLCLRLWLTIRGLSYRAREPAAIAPAALMRLDLLVSAATCLVMVDTVIGAPFATGNVVAALRVGEPWRVCRALVVETCFLCTAGAPARPRVERYLAKAREAARSVGRADTDALVTATRGVAHYFRGEWRAATDLLGRGLTAYEDFIQPMSGARTMTGYNFSARWEMSTFRYFKLVALMHLGWLEEMATCLATFARDAEDRGDLSALTNYRVGESNFHWLVRGEPETVASLVDEAMARWPGGTFLRQHWLALLARTQVDLYRGPSPATLARVEESWRPLERSLLLRIQYFDLRALHLRARATLACLGESATIRRDRLARCERDARAILRRNAPWANGLGHLVLAAVARQRGDTDASHAAVELAMAGFDAADMPLWADAARYRSGGLLGGDAGAALRTGAAERMRRAGVREPQRMIEMFAPGFDAKS